MLLIGSNGKRREGGKFKLMTHSPASAYLDNEICEEETGCAGNGVLAWRSGLRLGCILGCRPGRLWPKRRISNELLQALLRSRVGCDEPIVLGPCAWAECSASRREAFGRSSTDTADSGRPPGPEWIR